MERFLNKTKNIIFSKQKGIFTSSFILSIMIIVSSIFGFLRYRILAGYFTARELDLFFASFRIPDLVFEILITGALTSTLIPLFIKYQRNKAQLEENISSIFNILAIILFGFIIVLFFSMRRIIILITPGFNESQISTIVFYSRVLLLGQLPFFVIGNFFTGIAQAKKTFLVTAIAPVIYNLSIIFITIVFTPQFHLFAPIAGAVLGGILFLLIQLPIIFMLDFSFLPIIKITKGVVEFFRMMVPRILTVLVSQIDAFIDLTLTTLLRPGSYTVFYLAQHLQLLPVSVFGIAYGLASLPYISELYQEKRIDEFRKMVVNSILSLFFFVIPIMGFFIIARTPLVRLFFGGDKFQWEATRETAYTLSVFALALPFHSIYYFLVRSFYAILDNKTPFFISVFSIGINALLSVYFTLFLKNPHVWILAVTFTISIGVNVILLLALLSKKIGGLDIKMLFTETTKMLTSMFTAAFASYYLIKIMDPLLLDTKRTINIFFLLIISGSVYVVLYLFLSWLLVVKEMSMVNNLALRAKEYQKKIVELYANYE